MECNDTDSRLVQGGSLVGSEMKSGVGFDVQCLSPKPRVKKMDGEEKKSGSKRKLKPIKVGFGSDDDEPIGSLIRFKSKRNPKKVRVGLDGGCDKGKEIEVGVQKLVVKDEDLGGMDDTLASFRKKLKGPKKDGGSGVTMGRSLGMNAAEHSGQCLNGPVKDGDLAVESVSEIVEAGQVIGYYGCDGTINNEFESRGKPKIKRPKAALKLKKNGSNTESDDALDCQRCGDNSIQNQNEYVLGSGESSDHCLDENLEDSLSEFFRRAQSGFIRKSRSSLRSKQRRETQVLKEGSSPSSADVSDECSHVVVKRSPSVSKLAQKILKSENSLHNLSGEIPIYSAPDQNNIEIHQSSVDNLCQISDCREKDPLSSDPIQELASAPVTYGMMRSSDNTCSGYSEVVLEDSVPISSLQRFQSCLSACSNKIARFEDTGEVNRQTAGIQQGPTGVCCGSDHLCDGDSKDFLCAKVKNNCSLPTQEPTPEIYNFNDGLKNYSLGKASILVHDVVDLCNPISASEKMEEIHLFESGVSNVGPNENLDQQSEGLLTIYPPIAEQKNSSFGKEIRGPCSDDDSLNRPCEYTFNMNLTQLTGKSLEGSAKSPPQNSSPDNDKMDLDSKIEIGLDFDQCLKDSQHSQPHSFYTATGSPKKEETFSDYDAANQIHSACIEEPDLASVSSQKEDVSVSDTRSLPPTICGEHESEIVLMKDRKKSLEAGDNCNNYLQELCLTESVTSIEKCSSSHKKQPSEDASKGACIPNRDYLSINEEANGDSFPSFMPDRNDSSAEDAGSVPDPGSKDDKKIIVQRVARKPKKCRQGDMAYEGDADWEILIHEQGFLESHQVRDSDQFFKTREKFNSSSATVAEADNGGAAAVSAGLKAHAVGPVEKIKFKEILKQKGGLQEYIECRNQILSLWSKDVSRILPITDCGVTATPSAYEPPFASLLREIYTFLDCSGYINVGVASEKERAEPNAKHSFKLLKERNFGEKSGALVADSDDGVSFILGRGRNYEASMEMKNGVILDENRAAEPQKIGSLLLYRQWNYPPKQNLKNVKLMDTRKMVALMQNCPRKWLIWIFGVVIHPAKCWMVE